jgi:hypothetical protein
MSVDIGKVILGGTSKYERTMYTDIPVIKVPTIKDILIDFLPN